MKLSWVVKVFFPVLVFCNAQDISWDYGELECCSDPFDCENKTVEVQEGSDFAVFCGYQCSGTCQQTQFTVLEGCSLINDWRCTYPYYVPNPLCQGAEITIHSSDLTTGDFEHKLDCLTGASFSEGHCDSMVLRLFDSRLLLACAAQNCRHFTAYLHGESTLILDTTSTLNSDNPMKIFMYNTNSTFDVDDSLVEGTHYLIISEPMTSTEPTTASDDPNNGNDNGSGKRILWIIVSVVLFGFFIGGCIFAYYCNVRLQNRSTLSQYKTVSSWMNAELIVPLLEEPNVSGIQQGEMSAVTIPSHLELSCVVDGGSDHPQIDAMDVSKSSHKLATFNRQSTARSLTRKEGKEPHSPHSPDDDDSTLITNGTKYTPTAGKREAEKDTGSGVRDEVATVGREHDEAQPDALGDAELEDELMYLPMPEPPKTAGKY